MIGMFLIWTIVLCIRSTQARSYFTAFNMQQSSTMAIKENTVTTPIIPTTTTTTTTSISLVQSLLQRDISIGPCKWIIDRQCPDPEILFYLYTPRNPKDRQYVHIDNTFDKSNISKSYFDPHNPTKIIIHGYNSDMFLHPLQLMKDEYMLIGSYNLFYVDWSVLSPSPCYMSAVHNTRHVGACVAQLVERILDSGSTDIHVIGFSLGAQLSNYVAQNLGSFLLPRITGLDPAMPLFITAREGDKLDPTDAAFVDVIHTNAIVQGKLERCGHADFYMNGGIMQPGCYNSNMNSFACSHQRAPAYYLESIRSTKGFWGWQCSSFVYYMLGMCPPTNYLVEAGEHIKRTTRGMFIINTNDTSPYALGKWTDLPSLGQKITIQQQHQKHQQHQQQPSTITITAPPQKMDPLLHNLDHWGKLDYTFNNIVDNVTKNPYNNNKWLQQRDNAANHTFSHVTAHTTEISPPYETTAKKQQTVNWHEYRRNLTEGFIDNSVFQVPVIS